MNESSSGTIPAWSAPTQAAASTAVPGHPSESLRTADGRIYGGWWTTFASMVGLTLGPSCMLVFCFGTFVRPLEAEFGWGIGAISLGATLISVMIVITSLLAGFLIDRIGARTLVLWSTPLFGAGMACLSLLGPDIRFFYLGLVLVALVGVGVWPVSYNKLTANWFDRRLGFSLGLANLGIGLGAALLPALVAHLIPAYGWRTAYTVLGVLAVVIPWPITFFFFKDRPQEARSLRAAVPLASAGMDFAQARKTPEFWLSLGGFFVLGVASSSVVVHQMRILTDIGMPAPQAAAMQSVLGLALIVGRVCTGWLLDRMKVSVVMVVLCLLAALALALLSAGAPMQSAPLCAILVGFVIGAEFDVLGFLIPRYFGRRAFGAIYGVIFAVFQIAAASAIAVLGIVRSVQGTYSTALAVAAMLLAVGGFLFMKLGPYRYTAPHTAH